MIISAANTLFDASSVWFLVLFEIKKATRVNARALASRRAALESDGDHTTVPSAELYDQFDQGGFQYGPAFRLCRDETVKKNKNAAICELACGAGALAGALDAASHL